MAGPADVRRGRHAIWDLEVQLVFTTIHRTGALTDAVLTDCETVMRSVCEDFGCHLVEFDGGTDHVRLLVNFPATATISKLVNSLKGVSSRILRRDHGDHLGRYLADGRLWSRSYYAGTRKTSLDVIYSYIDKEVAPRR